jgi:hypothetical protein
MHTVHSPLEIIPVMLDNKETPLLHYLNLLEGFVPKNFESILCLIDFLHAEV